MKKLTGFKKVAVVKIYNSPYHYALYDNDIKIGDQILVSGTCKNVLTVDEIITLEEAETRCSKAIISEVICKVDLTNYNQRVANRKKAEELKKKMDKRISEMDEINKYIMYAEQDAELSNMLDEYKSLI